MKTEKFISLPEYSGIGLEAFDYISDTLRKLSFYSLKLFVDKILWFEIVIDELPFDQVGYVNSFIDYEQKLLENVNVYKQFVWPNQEIVVYKTINNRGWINFSDTLSHQFIILIQDKSGNSSQLDFRAKTTKDAYFDYSNSEQAKEILVPWSENTKIDSEEIKIEFPKNSLYSDICFSMTKKNISNNTIKPSGSVISSFFTIGDTIIPLKKPFIISFPIDSVPENLQGKLLISVLERNSKLVSVGGKVKNKFISASTKIFGTYALCIDTTPPTIIPINITSNKDMSKEENILFNISDELSGIEKYRGTIDNNWVLFEYDAKNDLLIYKFDPKRFIFNNTNHHVILIVSDKRGNKSTFISNFIK